MKDEDIKQLLTYLLMISNNLSDMDKKLGRLIDNGLLVKK